MAIVKEKKYILAEIRTNHNKHWAVELHDDGRVVSRWGRIGAPTRETELGYGEALFEAKCREKERKGYVEQKTLSSRALTSTALHKTSLQKVAAEQIQTNSREALDLIKRLAAANVHAILQSTTLQYNASNGTFSTPLGVLTQDAIDQARRVLTTIGEHVARSDYSSSLVHATNCYLNLVPQDFGRRRKTLRDLYPNLDAVREQNDLLDRLQTSLQLALTNPADPTGQSTQKVFEASVNAVHSRSEFHRLRDLYRSTLNRQHSAACLELKRVYTVEIASMKKAFEARAAAINNQMTLWHGTNTSNILSILHSGFKVQPPATAAITGKLFGNGIYFALQSTKSLNYGFGYWNGTKSKSCFLFLCDVAVGRYQVPKGGTSKRPDRGYDSYWAKTGRSGVVNDEIVIFDAQQINPRYLLEFSEKQ